MINVGFIGCGNMGGTIARAISRVAETIVYISDRDSTKVQSFVNDIDCKASDNISIAKTCKFIFLAVKPNIVGAIAKEISKVLSENPDSVLVSMAAGVSTEKLAELFGKEQKIIRIMPNTPIAVDLGLTLWCTNSKVDGDDTREFLDIMEYTGTLDRIDEGLIDAASAVSGCGPAFVYMFAEALADGAVKCGLPRDKALSYAAQTLKGAAEMILKTAKHPERLKDEVCSPGGSTIEGVLKLEEGSFRADTASAVTAAYEKTKKLG